jgi:polyhydroxybutyrate depolymerase
MKLRLAMVAVVACLVFPAASALAQAGSFEVTKWTIDGQTREAIVIPPTRSSGGPAPVVLVFHGHGGTMQRSVDRGFQREWPEAIIVCPQGLPTATPADPQGTRAGWQSWQGDEQDRDLKFVGAIIRTLHQKYDVDDRRIYATGHSNGGRFTYLLWTARGRELAAIAPSSAPAVQLIRRARGLVPLPVLHLAGERDQVVAFRLQERTMEEVRARLGCSSDGKPWARAGDVVGTLYPSSRGTPFVSLIHPGTHRYPPEATGLIVRFFKEHARG